MKPDRWRSVCVSCIPSTSLDGSARVSPRSHDAFCMASRRTAPGQASRDSPSLCPYKVPSGSKLPTRDMAYYRAYINVMILPGLSALL